MKYIRQLRGSLTQNFNEGSLKFNMILRELIVGLVLVLITGVVSELFLKQSNSFINILLGFSVSYFLFADTAIYLIKNIKKLSVVRINIIAIRDLLIILFFFIIAYRFIKPNFIFTAVGITITPVSAAVLLLISKKTC